MEIKICLPSRFIPSSLTLFSFEHLLLFYNFLVANICLHLLQDNSQKTIENCFVQEEIV